MTNGQDFIRPQDLAKFFAQEDALTKHHLSIFFGRADGVLLFSRPAQDFSADQESSLGVLLASAWQASQAMAVYFPQTAADEFRYNFATTDQGIYLLAFPWQGEAYFLAALYQGQTNPGAIKMLLRSSALHLQEFLRVQHHSTDQTKSSAEKPLFNDITDDEMNKLFAFAENS
ncbi:MAG: hypothetical protein J6Y94_08245 [Bacteriovoracaceae bacterium]|nr:hypothetical protein [Bacteriovoracaceae bacterium]